MSAVQGGAESSTTNATPSAVSTHSEGVGQTDGKQREGRLRGGFKRLKSTSLIVTHLRNNDFSTDAYKKYIK